MTASLAIPGFAISMAVSPPSRVAKEPTKCSTPADEASRPVHVFICGMGYVGLRFALSMRLFQATPCTSLSAICQTVRQNSPVTGTGIERER
jgi:hypothetical protein